MQFEKGVSGNPKGRPRKGTALTDELNKILAKKDTDGLRFKDKIAARLVALALANNLDAIKYIYDRVDGRPMQAMEHAGEDGSPLVFTLRLANDNRDETDSS